MFSYVGIHVWWLRECLTNKKVVNFNNTFLTYTQYIWRQKSYQLFLWSQYDSSTIVYLFVSLPDVSHLCSNEWILESIKDIVWRQKNSRILLRIRFVVQICCTKYQISKMKKNFFHISLVNIYPFHIPKGSLIKIWLIFIDICFAKGHLETSIDKEHFRLCSFSFLINYLIRIGRLL